MSNGVPQQPSSDYKNHPAWQILRDFLTFLTVAFSFYAAQQSAKNHTKIEDVEVKQGEAAVKQDDAAAKTDKVKAKLDERAAEEIKSQGVVLYSTWKYLEDVAASSGSARDKDKAAEAKQTFDAHVKKYAKP